MTPEPGARSAAPVRAAGVVVARPGPRGPEVLLVHRPRYDDWSWPKGKAEPGEPDVVAAARELEEETGLACALGRPLPGTTYLLADGRPKQVAYWSASAPAGTEVVPPRPHEVDEVAWCSPAEAARLLTRPADRGPLVAATPEEATAPLVLLRHAEAVPRDGWTGDEEARPLSEAGEAQAEGVAVLLRSWRPRAVVSSPWARCAASVSPYAREARTMVTTWPALTEAAWEADSDDAAAVVRSVLADLRRTGRSALVCTHRPVLGTAVEVLAAAAADDAPRRALPADDPWLEPGEVLVAHVRIRDGAVVAVERHGPHAS